MALLSIGQRSAFTVCTHGVVGLILTAFSHIFYFFFCAEGKAMSICTQLSLRIL